MRSGRIFVGGGSAAVIILYVRDKGDVSIAFQIPLFPILDDYGTDNVSKYAASQWKIITVDFR